MEHMKTYQKEQIRTMIFQVPFFFVCLILGRGGGGDTKTASSMSPPKKSTSRMASYHHLTCKGPTGYWTLESVHGMVGDWKGATSLVEACILKDPISKSKQTFWLILLKVIFLCTLLLSLVVSHKIWWNYDDTPPKFDIHPWKLT